MRRLRKNLRKGRNKVIDMNILLEKDSYYLVKGLGVFNCTIVRLGAAYDEGKHIAYMGRSRVIVRDSDIVRKASKEEADPRNARNLCNEVYGTSL